MTYIVKPIGEGSWQRSESCNWQTIFSKKDQVSRRRGGTCEPRCLLQVNLFGAW